MSGSMSVRGGAAAAACAVAISAAAHAQPVNVEVVAPESVAPGTPFQIEVRLELERGWYLYAPTGVNAGQGLIETSVSMRDHEYAQFADARFPEPISFGAYDILTGEVVSLLQPVRFHPRTPSGDMLIRGMVEYQTCDGDTCLPPIEHPIRVLLRVED